VLLADAHTPRTIYAKVVIPIEKRINLLHFQVLVADREFDFFDFQVLDNFLEFAVPVIGTPPAPGGDAHFADGVLGSFALFGFFADKTAGGMFTENELQDFFSHLLESAAVGAYLHSLLHTGGTGDWVPPYPVNFDNAQPAPAVRGELRMGAEMRDIDVIDPCCLKYGYAFVYVNFPVIDCEFHDFYSSIETVLAASPAIASNLHTS
jgi:hypothetical protein